MTDVELQDALVKEVQELLQHQSLKKLDGDAWKNLNVYKQDKPYKNDEADEDQEDYIIVMLDDEDTDENGNWIVTVHFLVSICLFEEENQGNIMLASLMNQLDLYFYQKRIIAGRYSMEKERHKRFNQEHYQNFYESAYITKWKLPGIKMKGLDEFI